MSVSARGFHRTGSNGQTPGALHDGAARWTLNRDDFRDLPGLTVI